MQARMPNPVLTTPGALDAMLAFNGSARDRGVPERTMSLAQFRTSQIRGCHVCVGQHCGILRKEGASEDQIDAVASWRDSREFSPSERAALGLAEELALTGDVADETWELAARHFDGPALSALLIGIAATTVANVLNLAVRQQPPTEAELATVMARHAVTA